MLILKNKFINDQLRLKLFCLKKNSFLNKNVKKMYLYLNLYKVESFLDNNIIESLLLVEFFTNSKTSINNCIYKYKLCNIQLLKHLNNLDNCEYLFDLFKIFYLPSLKRQNFLISIERLNFGQFNYSLTDINIMPFLPNIYYKWKIPINLSFFFNQKYYNEIMLYLLYLGFHFSEEKDIIKYFYYTDKQNLNF